MPIPHSELQRLTGQYREPMRELDESSPPKSGHSLLLLIGILLTCLAMVGHRFLPERRLALEGSETSRQLLPDAVR